MLWCTHLLVEHLSSYSYSDDSPPGTRALPRRRPRGHGVRAAVPRSWTAVDTSSPPACVRREPVATDQARLRLRRAAASVDGPGELRCRCVVLWPRPRRRSAAASRYPPPGASLAAALTRTTESPTGAHARSGPHVFDPTARRDARGGRYIKYRPPPIGHQVHPVRRVEEAAGATARRSPVPRPGVDGSSPSLPPLRPGPPFSDPETTATSVAHRPRPQPRDRN